MKHFVPIDTGTGWGVCYRNFRGEFVPIMECVSFDVAYDQCVKHTQDAMEEAMRGAALYAAKQVKRELRA